MHGQMFPDAETAPYSSAAPVASLTSKILIRSVAIRQSKTILARSCAEGRAKYHFVVAVWRAKEAESLWREVLGDHR